MTHGIFGATLAVAKAPQGEARVAAGIGFLAGMLADADVLIGSARDPLLVLGYHRHFTHALLFVPLGALLATAALWPLLRRHLGFARIYLYAFLGYALAGILDACTSYGTLLFWPFSGERVAFSIVAVVDPALTLAIALPLAIAVVRRRAAIARVGLALALCYLALGLLQRERAEAAARELAQQRGHEPRRLLVKPTLANLLLWRSIYIAGGRIHADGIRVGALSPARIYPGESAALVVPAQDIPWAPPGSPALAQAERFAAQADGYLAWHPRSPRLLGDARYAMLPTSVEPLWGIEFDAANATAQVKLVSERTLTPEARQRFFDMLFGR